MGSGASGCEFLKNFALMGVATLPNHSIKLVDEAIIKPTNVNSHHWLRFEYYFFVFFNRFVINF